MAAMSEPLKASAYAVAQAEAGAVDTLYVLQLRNVLVNELTSNLSAFAQPLDRWLKEHEVRIHSTHLNRPRRLINPLL